MKRPRSLWSKSTAALMPANVSPARIVQANVTPDIAVESVLFHAYLREKARADRCVAELKALRADLKMKRAWARVQRLTKLKPSAA